MARKRRQKVKEPQVTGTTYLRKVLPLVERLHDEVCVRDKAGNRRLHGDHSSMLFRLELFNPAVVSLRSLQLASEEEPLAQSAKRAPQPPNS